MLAFLSLVAPTTERSAARADFVIVPANAVGGAAVGDSIGRGLGGALQGIGNARASSRQLNQRFVEAKRDFFTAKPGSPERAQAEAELAKLLLYRDLHYAAEAFMRSVSEQLTPGQDIMGLINLLAIDGGAIGGGIPEHAETHYDQWTGLVVREMDAGLVKLFTGGLDVDSFQDAFEKTLPAYDRYRLVRDYGMFAERGQLGSFFPTAESWLRFHLLLDPASTRENVLLRDVSDKQIDAELKALIDCFGEDALREVADMLRVAPTHGPLTLARPIHGEQMATKHTGVAAVQLLMKKSPLRGTGMAALMDGEPIGRFGDGKLRFDAIIETHGEQAMRRVLEQLRDADLNLDFRVNAGEWSGLSPYEVMTKELPLSDDPVIAARAAAAEAERQRRAAAEAAALAAAKAKGQADSLRQHERFVEALKVARFMDQERIDGLIAAGREPVLDPFFSEVRRVNQIAALWNEFAVTGEYAAAQKTLDHQRVSAPKNPYGEAIFNLLSFTRNYRQVDVRSLTPLAEIQATLLSDGHLDPADALDLRMHRDRVRLEQQILYANEYLANLGARPDDVEARKAWDYDYAVNKAVLDSLLRSATTMDAATRGAGEWMQPGAWLKAAREARAAALAEGPPE